MPTRSWIRKRGDIWLALLCVVGGILFFWPLGVVGIAIAAFSNRFIVAVLYGISFDVLYGPPPNFHFLLFPFTLFAVLAILARIVALRYVRRKGRGDFL